jgi:hypothetical protein
MRIGTARFEKNGSIQHNTNSNARTRTQHVKVLLRNGKKKQIPWCQYILAFKSFFFNKVKRING